MEVDENPDLEMSQENPDLEIIQPALYSDEEDDYIPVHNAGDFHQERFDFKSMI